MKKIVNLFYKGCDGMFCGECGAKCNKDDLFCGECGAPLKKEEKENKSVKKRKPISKKNKLLITIITILVIVLVVVIVILSNVSSPKSVAENFFKALATNDGKKMYQYLNIEDDNTFTSEKIFESIIKAQEKDDKIENYEITNVTYGTGKLSADVTITYTTKNSSNEKTMVLSLTKAKDKKWLFFDDWNVNFKTNSLIVEDFKIWVPKKSKVTFGGIKVSNKYLDNSMSTSEKDCYVLNQVFAAKTNVEVKLDGGFVIKDEVIPSSYRNSYTASVSLDSVSEKEQEKIKDVILKDLTSVYNGVIQNKGFEEIKQTLSAENETNEVKNAYDDLLEEVMDSSNILTAINFNKVTLSSLKLDDEGNFKIRFKANYAYSIKYQDFSGNEMTKDSSDYSYIDFTYNIKDGNYHLVDIDNLEDYFSRY